ncbi:MAG: MmgE/PrpD family protein [Variovorax sp.]|nr:MmgE/PrpD family protein [Variovorax sp.]
MRGVVRAAFVDTTACMLAGRDEPVTTQVAQWAGLRSDGDAMPLPARADESALAPALAALVNATAGHALDYDDVGLAGHPSVVLVPALLAVHEADGVRGFALVQAYAKGYAVWAELQSRMTVHLHGRGWHPTAVFGTVAAAAAVASARGLPASQVAHAIGIAASSASGLIANFGSMTKALQVGRAARAGLEAAELAACGVDASFDALDGPTGLLAALAGPGNARLEADVEEGFESTLLRIRPGIKKYPVCYAAHRVADGVLDLKAEHKLMPSDVTAVDATISATTAGVLRHHAPATLSEARFSLEYVVATALVHGALGLREVDERSLADPAVRALMPLIRTHITDTRCPLEPSFAYEDRVTITTRDGTIRDSGPIRFARGHAQLPLDEAQLRDKLWACVRADEEALAMAALDRIDAALAA